MLTMLKNWKGAVEIDGKQYDNINAFISTGAVLSESINIKLLAERNPDVTSESRQHIEQVDEPTEYKITVRQYMTKQSDGSFDFMKKWNNDIPMPMRTAM